MLSHTALFPSVFPMRPVLYIYIYIYIYTLVFTVSNCTMVWIELGVCLCLVEKSYAPHISYA